MPDISYFTSESVTEGHPDKVCDQIADRILDELLREDPYSRVACEVTAISEGLHIFGEITSKARVDYAGIARGVITEIGYTEPGHGFDAESCEITVNLHEQSPDIAMGVDRADPLDSGAGDQGIMVGYACRETDCLMPLPIELAHALSRRLAEVRHKQILPYLLPDGKSQVTVEYRDGVPCRIKTVVVSSQHEADTDEDTLRRDIIKHVIVPTLPEAMLDDNTEYLINPTGRFIVGGPAGDSGLTGRKLIADTYGGYSRHGGGAFSGKDPTKVDRSGAYMARYLAKNIVAAGYADRCEIQLGYAIGIAEPVSFRVDTFCTEHIPVKEILEKVRATVDLRPSAIIGRLGLRSPVYARVSCYGHFGSNAAGLPWERTDLAKEWAASEECPADAFLTEEPLPKETCDPFEKRVPLSASIPLQERAAAPERTFVLPEALADRKICVLGDSIAKGIVWSEERGRYTNSGYGCVDLFQEAMDLDIVNFSRFGCTLPKGFQIAQRHAEALKDSAVFVAYGGNDSDFRWPEIAENPDADHDCNTPLPAFLSAFNALISFLKKEVSEIFVLNLPPIDADRYFAFFSKGLNKENLLKWLGGSVKGIYAWQEMFSQQAYNIALKWDLPLIDIRTPFLARHNLPELLCSDGIHPSRAAQQLIFDTVDSYFRRAD